MKIKMPDGNMFEVSSIQKTSEVTSEDLLVVRLSDADDFERAVDSVKEGSSPMELYEGDDKNTSFDGYALFNATKEYLEDEGIRVNSILTFKK